MKTHIEKQPIAVCIKRSATSKLLPKIELISFKNIGYPGVRLIIILRYPVESGKYIVGFRSTATNVSRNKIPITILLCFLLTFTV